MRFWAGTLARNLPAALDIYADILRRPHLPDDELEAVQALALQDIQGLEDEPQQKVMVELRRRYYPPPLDRSRRGTAEDIEALTPDDAARVLRPPVPPERDDPVGGRQRSTGSRSRTRSSGCSATGKAARSRSRSRRHTPRGRSTCRRTRSRRRSRSPSRACRSADPDYYAARGAVGVLSGGMSARLFTEVREKRGLCYSVYATHETFKDRGTVIGYAGTRAERAQETLDVMVAELRRLKDGVTDDEVDRVKAGLKSSLIMQEESTSARAGSMATDWYYLGRVRTVDEIQAAIDGLTPATILEHLERYPVRT